MRNLTFILLAFLCIVGVCKCVVEECPMNEVYFECGENCQRECATLNKPCTIRHVKCPNGCYCAEGFARVSVGGGACLPISECPGKSHVNSGRTLSPEELGNQEQQKQEIRKMRRRPLKSSNQN